MVDLDQRAQLRRSSQQGPIEERYRGLGCFPASRRSNGAHTAGQPDSFRGWLCLHAGDQHRPANIISVQRGDPVTGREVQAHQTLVGILMQWGEDEAAPDRFNSSLKLSCLELY